MDSACYRIDSPSVIFETFDNELVAIHLDTGAYHSLTDAGADAFQLLAGEATARELAEALEQKYAETAANIEKAMLPFLADLQAEKLIVRVDTPSSRGPLQIACSAAKLPFTPPRLQAYHDLQSLFLLDPVHEVGEQGWPQFLPETKSVDETAL